MFLRFLQKKTAEKEGKVVAEGGKKIRIVSGVEKEACVSDDSNSEDEAMDIVKVIQEMESPVVEDKECFLKTPQKRKLLEHHNVKQAKRLDGSCDIQTDKNSETESETEMSECSVSASLPLSGFSSREYTVEEIKNFLDVTKNMRGVKIAEYFPDIKQFIEKVKVFRGKNSFTDQDVFRLKKILTKLNG